MSSDAAISQPRKRGWKAWLLGLACVVAVITIVFLATAPKPEPVKVWFVRSTNEMGEKKLFFQGTNGIPKQVYYVACVATGAVRHARMPSGLRPGYNLTSGVAAARE